MIEQLLKPASCPCDGEYVGCERCEYLDERGGAWRPRSRGFPRSVACRSAASSCTALTPGGSPGWEVDRLVAFLTAPPVWPNPDPMQDAFTRLYGQSIAAAVNYLTTNMKGATTDGS